MSKHTIAKKPQVVQKHQIHAKDSGSPEVQIAVLTEDVYNLTTHLKANPKDFSSRRGLIKKVSKRRSLLRYLSTVSQSRYKKTLAVNNLKAI
jgi:small subunit ribosomal protein S15